MEKNLQRQSLKEMPSLSEGSNTPAARALVANLRLPVIGSPMFIVSSWQLVAAQCCAGVIGAFPALNARPQEELPRWLECIEERRRQWNASSPAWPAAPCAVNLIVHPSNARLAPDLDVVCAHQAPLVITSLNAPGTVVERVHAYGGLVLADVSSMRHARKAIDAGVDGLILVCAGAGGHTGTLNPLAFTDEVRRVFDGLVAVAGCIAHGRQIVAVQAMGADLAYVGTRFIATPEANVDARYHQMLVDADAADIVNTNAVTGLHANYLRESFNALGLDPDRLAPREKSSFSFGTRSDGTQAKAWRDIWSAGQGVGVIDAVMPAADVVARMAREYAAARVALR